MSTIAKEFTKEQLIARADHLLCVGKAFIADHPGYDGMAKDVELFKIALASLEAEPVYFVEIEDGQDINAGRIEGKNRPDLSLLPDGINHLYAAPPAPVSVPDDLEMKPILTDEGQIVGYEYQGERYGLTAGCAWNTAIRTFRAAMLQGADGNSPVIPDGWVACSERMPTKQDGTVFLTWNGHYISKELFLMGSFHCLKPEIITHWMPLPAAPQQE